MDLQFTIVKKKLKFENCNVCFLRTDVFTPFYAKNAFSKQDLKILYYSLII